MFNINQAEADELIRIPKFSIDVRDLEFPGLGGILEAKLQDDTGKEEFVLNYRKDSIRLEKQNNNFRVRGSIILLRLDLNGPPHTNPDGTKVSNNHIHIYREGFADKWAFDVPIEHFKNLNSSYETLHDFMKYCNIVHPPIIRNMLFS